MSSKQWRRVVFLGVCAVSLAGRPAFAAEHGGATQEHGGATHEHGGMTQEHAVSPMTSVEPSPEAIRDAIRIHVAQAMKTDGRFAIADDVTGTERTLELVRVHERIGKTGSLYYACTDMRDTDSGEMLDLDFDVEAAGSTLKVVETRIHKVDGNARYTYDEHDNRVPLQ